MQRVDIAVIGLGVIGCAAVNALAREGLEVLGIDRYDPPHANGSSHGETRLARLAYSEGPDYVPFLRRTLDLWAGINIRHQTPLFRRTGLLYAAPTADGLIEGVLQSAREHDLHITDGRSLSVVQEQKLLRIPDDWVTVFETDAGYILAEDSCRFFLDEARQWGAEIKPNTQVLAIEPAENPKIIHTITGEIHADKIILCAGPWSGDLLPDLARLLKIRRRVVHWHEDSGNLYTTQAGFPPFVTQAPSGDWPYCLPNDYGSGVKVGLHGGTDYIDHADAIDRTIGDSDTEETDRFARDRLPNLGKRESSTVCMYTMSPDQAFIIDRHPDHDGLIIAAGMSGHGFKFAPAIGEALAAMVLDRPLDVDLTMFSLDRFQT